MRSAAIVRRTDKPTPRRASKDQFAWFTKNEPDHPALKFLELQQTFQSAASTFEMIRDARNALLKEHGSLLVVPSVGRHWFRLDVANGRRALCEMEDVVPFLTNTMLRIGCYLAGLGRFYRRRMDLRVPYRTSGGATLTLGWPALRFRTWVSPLGPVPVGSTVSAVVIGVMSRPKCSLKCSLVRERA